MSPIAVRLVFMTQRHGHVTCVRMYGDWFWVGCCFSSTLNSSPFINCTFHRGSHVSCCIKLSSCVVCTNAYSRVIVVTTCNHPLALVFQHGPPHLMNMVSSAPTASSPSTAVPQQSVQQHPSHTHPSQPLPPPSGAPSTQVSSAGPLLNFDAMAPPPPPPTTEENRYDVSQGYFTFFIINFYFAFVFQFQVFQYYSHQKL